MADCVISKTYNRADNGVIYDHIDGTTAVFHLVAFSGADLYSKNCQQCHGELANSTHKGATLSQIYSAIQNVPEMKTVAGLSALTPVQRQAIAHALRP